MTSPDQHPRSPAQREADHAEIARLAEALVPALVQRLGSGALGELEVREGAWSVRLRRPPQASVTGRRRGIGVHHVPFGDTARPPRADAAPAAAPGRDGDASGFASDAGRHVATAPAVGLFRSPLAVGTAVRAGDRIATVDLLGIPQDVVAPADGILVDVLAEPGEAVEYGEPLAVVAAPEQQTTGPGADAGADA